MHSPLMLRRHRQLSERTTRLSSFDNLQSDKHQLHESKKLTKTPIKFEEKQLSKRMKEVKEGSSNILQKGDTKNVSNVSKNMEFDQNQLQESKKVKDTPIMFEENLLSNRRKEAKEVSSHILQKGDAINVSNVSENMQSDQYQLLESKKVKDTTIMFEENQLSKRRKEGKDVSSDILKKGDTINVSKVSENLQSEKYQLQECKTRNKTPTLCKENQKGDNRNLQLVQENIAENRKDIIQLATTIKHLFGRFKEKVKNHNELMTELKNFNGPKAEQTIQTCLLCNEKITEYSKSQKCRDCYLSEYNLRRQSERSTQKISKYTNARYLNTPRVMSMMRHERRMLNRRMNRLISRYRKTKVETVLKFKDGSKPYNHLQKVFAYMKSNKGEFVKEVIESTLRIIGTSNTEYELDECTEFANHIVEQISNMSIRMSGNEQNQRYSPQLLSIANAIWLRSKAAYNQVRESNLVMLPSPRQLSHYKKREVKTRFEPIIVF